jgi:unsaturated rhamnogalacturonyl hydrolase
MDKKWSVAMTESFIRRYPIVSDMPFQKKRSWNYENGVIMTAVERLWDHTGEERYYQYIKDNMDLFVSEDGSIDTYRINDYNVDQVNQGKGLFLLYEKTGDVKYRKALELLITQMKGHPRTSGGGLWHKKIYPFQMWLDGVYMTSPLLAAYADKFEAPEWFDDVAHEILLMEQVSRDPVTGLLYHGWDESKEQRWADKVTGCSPHFWGRAVGWFMMAVVDVLDFFPLDHSKRGHIIGIFHRLAEAVIEVQDSDSGLWYQVLDQGSREGNYLEASASSMFVCALTKGARLGYLGQNALDAAICGYEGLLKHCVEETADGHVHLNHVCGVAGLGGKPYRDGSYEYYVGEIIRQDDPKGVGPFIMACLEIELSKEAQ